MSMSRLTRRAFFALVLLAALAFATIVLAQTSGSYDLSWNRIGSGGRSSSAGYVVHGSIGQPAVGQAQMSSPGYRLTGGFWYPAMPPAQYLPLIAK